MVGMGDGYGGSRPLICRRNTHILKHWIIVSNIVDSVKKGTLVTYFQVRRSTKGSGGAFFDMQIAPD